MICESFVYNQRGKGHPLYLKEGHTYQILDDLVLLRRLHFLYRSSLVCAICVCIYVWPLYLHENTVYLCTNSNHRVLELDFLKYNRYKLVKTIV